MTSISTGPLGPHSVRRMGYGAMQLAGPGVFGPPRDRNEALAVLRHAVQRGVDHIDTSQYYGPDVVNELIYEALHPYPDGLHLVSKVGGRRDERGAWLPAQRPEELRSGVEDNLRSLDVERLTAVNLRLMEAAQVPLAEQLGTMQELVDEGKIELIGISNADVPVVREALEQVPIACVQNAYSVIDRTHEDVLELCAERGMAFVPFFPLGSAFTGGPAALAADPAIAEVAERHGATPAQVALAWLLARDGHVLLIPGTASRGHLEENLDAAELDLGAEDMATLEQVRPVGNPLEGHN
ncbi:MAG TPA: oxidoreductase [Solirubrobacteraceae bacterium]|jgi:aryl-alcohol dehydrogenase-like predicted oxidoreductase|nr:oxidoreductase [Solirubrobacteraceae bacterium]